MEWISVEDSLPENDYWILLWVENLNNSLWKEYRIGSHESKRFYATTGIDYTTERITHWMPLPEPPKTK